MKNIRITAAALLACCLLVPSLAEPGYSPDSPAINNKPTTQPINIVIGEGQEKAVPITKKGTKTTPVVAKKVKSSPDNKDAPIPVKTTKVPTVPNPPKNMDTESRTEEGDENYEELPQMMDSPYSAQATYEVEECEVQPDAGFEKYGATEPTGKSKPKFPFIVNTWPVKKECGSVDISDNAVVLTVAGCAAGECATPDGKSSRVESASVTKFGTYTVDMEIPSGGALETSDVTRYFTFTPSKVSPSSSPEEGANVINIENVGFRMFTAAAQSGNDDSKTEISCFIDAKSVNKALGSAPKGDATQTLDRAEAQDKAQPAGGVVETFGAVIDTQPIKPSDSVDVADQNEDSESKKYTIGVYPEYIEYLVDGSVVHQVRAAAIAEKWGMPEAENVLFACNGGKAIFGIDSNPSRTKGAPKKDAVTQSPKASEQQKSLCMTVKSVEFEAGKTPVAHPVQSAKKGTNLPLAKSRNQPIADGHAVDISGGDDEGVDGNGFNYDDADGNTDF